MRVFERTISRRSVLAGGAAAALAWLSHPLLKSSKAQQAGVIVAGQVSRAPIDPNDPAWSEAAPISVSLNPQNLVVPRLEEAGAKEMNVRALFDAERLVFLLDWQDAHKDTDLGTVLQYRDAVAVQFPEDPSKDTPSITMGQQGNGVVIYHWKSDWQFGPLHDVDETYPNMYADWYPLSGVQAGQIPEATDYLTAGQKEYLTAAAVGNELADPQAQQRIGPVQKMHAEGFGTIEPDGTQDGKGGGAWQEGGWRIVISVPRKQAKFNFQEGTEVPVAFAVWDGSRNERNGQKAFSLWNTVRMGIPVAAPREEPGDGLAGFLIAWLGGLGGFVLALLTVLIGIRLRRARKELRQ